MEIHLMRNSLQPSFAWRGLCSSLFCSLCPALRSEHLERFSPLGSGVSDLEK